MKKSYEPAAVAIVSGASIDILTTSWRDENLLEPDDDCYVIVHGNPKNK